MARTMTVRLDDELWTELEVVARLSERSATDVVRAAIAELIEEQRADPEFRRQVRAMADTNRSRLSRFKQP
jgi:predicted transcriptional regulator